mmetsp:Transcript_130521/g.363697  ORF Transcript_130521/g.363697 Transcript_130521/m.363697 type:complete len:94 (-) Transcript_130521:435-716(-)
MDGWWNRVLPSLCNQEQKLALSVASTDARQTCSSSSVLRAAPPTLMRSIRQHAGTHQRGCLRPIFVSHTVPPMHQQQSHGGARLCRQEAIGGK